MSESQEVQIRELRRQIALRDRQLEAVSRMAAQLSSITKLDETIEEALRTSLDVVDAGAGSILLYDPAKNKLVFEHVEGEKAAELIGMELAPDQGIAGAVFQSGKTRVSEDVSQEKDHLRDVGERISYQTRNMVTVPLRSYSGKCIGVLQVLNKTDGRFDEHDVATLEIVAAHVAAGIEAARLQEEARLAQVVKFIGDISHDVKNMITPVQTSAETLRFIGEDVFAQFDAAVGEVSCSAEERERLRNALKDLRELLPEMCDLILDGSDAVQQRMAEISAAVKGIVSEPHFERADIVDVVQRAVALLEHQAAKVGIRLVVDTPAPIPEFPIDKKRIYNAVYNLVFNAMEACEEGDTVTVRVTCVPEGTFPEGCYCQVDCVDTGAGMPEHVRARLFTDDAISTKPMGTGLGTRIIKNVVDAHHGLIWVESEQGVGTTISFKIPMNLKES